MKHTNKLFAILLAVVLTLVLALPMSFAADTKSDQSSLSDLRVISMSDTHFIPEDMIKGTEDFQHVLNRDQKVLNESEAVVDAQLQKVRQTEPDILLLSGDVSKDGEYRSHQALAKKLRKLKKDMPKLKVYVINGNHDINNSRAQDFNTKNGKAVPAKMTTPQDFRKIYDDITWQDKTVKETYGLSYVARPAKGFTLIALDSNCYTADMTSDGTNEHETRGAIPDDLLQWALKQTKRAVKRGDTVIGMMHHGIVAHFTQQPTIAGDFLVDNYKTVSTKLADAGMHYVFTGHYHSQDVSVMTTEAGNTIYDIETGSSITYPCPMRAVQFIRDSSGSAETDNAVKEKVKGTTLQNLSIAHTDPQTGVYTNIPDMTAFAKNKGFSSDVISTILKDALGDALGSSYPKELDTAIDKLIPDLLNMPVTEDGKHPLIEVVNYAHQKHLAGLDHGSDPAWFKEARQNVKEGKILAALADTLSKDLAVLVGDGINRLTDTQLIQGPAVDALYHGLFGAAHVSYVTVPKLAKDFNQFLLKTMDSLTKDKNFPADVDFVITDANKVRPGAEDWSSVANGVPSTNIVQLLIGALLGNG
ncbi:MAG: metallophosphoesterase [Acutalibacteraceae bacterium]|nr:metallophosphoesterase [Acutalibacteraceae bacterium]MEE1300849.1 metallophosphoesterase [Acutalibacteraceae bacterium]